MSVLTRDFQQSLHQMADQDSPLHEYRQKALKSFEKIDFFNQKLESFQYFRLASALENLHVHAPKLQPGCEEKISQLLQEKAINGPKLVIYNGHFLPRFSDVDQLSKQMIIKPLSEALNGYGVFFKNLFDQWLSHEKDPLALTSLIAHQEGLFLYVPNNQQIKETLHVVEINDAASQEVIAPLVVVSAGKQSALKIVSHSVALQDNESSLCFATYLVQVEDRAQVQQVHYSSKNQSTHLQSVRAFLKQQSQYKMVDLTHQSLKSRTSFWLQLLKPGAEAEIFSLAALRKKQQSHTHILIEHLAEQCYSRQLVKNVLNDEAYASFEGKIWVDAQAQQTNAYQLNQNSLLSDKAKCFSKPNLEIFADDVKASHGSTTGQMDIEQLFYLQSRGLSQGEAYRLLLSGFCQEVLNHISDEPTRNMLESQFNEFYEGL